MPAVIAAPTAERVDPRTIVYLIRPDDPAASAKTYLQCLGTGSNAPPPGSTINGSNGTGGQELKHGWVADPAATGKMVSYFAVRATDPDTAGEGNKRCEFAFPGKSQLIPWDRAFWFSTAVRTGDFAGSTDEQTIWQWHDGSPVTGLSPFLVAYVSGRRMSIQLRWNQDPALARNATTMVDLYSSDQWQPLAWYTFTVLTKLDSTNNQASQVQIWINGKLTVDYTGPAGYLHGGAQDYAKVGLYHWTNSGNDWSAAVPKREAWFKGPALVMHRSGYTPALIEGLIQ